MNLNDYKIGTKFNTRCGCIVTYKNKGDDLTLYPYIFLDDIGQSLTYGVKGNYVVIEDPLDIVSVYELVFVSGDRVEYKGNYYIVFGKRNDGLYLCQEEVCYYKNTWTCLVAISGDDLKKSPKKRLMCSLINMYRILKEGDYRWTCNGYAESDEKRFYSSWFSLAGRELKDNDPFNIPEEFLL